MTAERAAGGAIHAAQARAAAGAPRQRAGAPRAGRAAALAALAALVACTQEPQSPAFSAQARTLQVRLRGIAFQRFVGEQLEFEVRAASGTFEPGRRSAVLEDVKTRFRDTERRGDVQLAARSGDFDLVERSFVLSGDVEGSTAAGERFSTSAARYDQAAAKIVIDHPVTLESGRVRSRGSGLVLDLASREFTLFDIEGRREGTP
jgi:LPS export ABC transporter protein LptC